MPLAEALVALAALAGNTVVTAAVTDAWESARKGFARLLGRGDPAKTQLAEERLAETHDQLTQAAGADLEPVHAELEAQWVTRMRDLLEEDPGVEADLRTLVQEIQAQLPAGTVSAANHSVAAGRDVIITASSGAVAAGVIHGNVAPPYPPPAGSGEPVAAPGADRVPNQASVSADRGAVAVGQLQLPPQDATVGQLVRLAPRPPVLAGREALLTQLNALLSAADGLASRIVALCGLGGAGKTSVAVEYAYRHLAEVGVAWEFAAEDATVLAAGFGELAAQLGARGLADTRDPVASVHAVLARFPEPWLLMFDNAADLASVAAFLPPAGPGRVLITSRNQIWPPRQALDVPVLDTEVAAEFLVNRTGDPDRRAALDLAAELGGLPLALEQAASYVQASGDSLAGYLASFRQRRADLLGRGEPTGYSQTVATTWRLAFEDVQHAAPGAVGLLRLLAFCAPEAIPLRPLLQPRPGLIGRFGEDVRPVLVPLLEDRLAAGDAIGALRRYSLLTPAADRSVSVHRLVQAVTADQMAAELAAEWRQAAAALIEAAVPADTRRPESWPVCAALLPHAQAALARDSHGMGQLANYVGYQGSHQAALELWQQVLDVQEQSFGPEHPGTLTAKANLARWTGVARDATGARDQFAALLPIQERVLGAEHPNTLRARADAARWAGEAGDAAGARDQFAALLPIEERVLGAEHTETLRGRANLARFTGEAGDTAGARDQFAALLPIEERVLGAEHPYTLTTRANLARWTGQAGDPAAARDLLAHLLPMLERVLGPDDPYTLTSRNNLAYWTEQAEHDPGRT